MAIPKAKLRASKQEATNEWLAGRAMPAGGAWATAARKEAVERVRALTLPTKRDEYWKYTDPTSLTAAEAPEASLFEITDEGAVFEQIDRVRLVFVDGVFDAAASDDPSLAGVEITRLAEAAGNDIHWAKDYYGVLEAAGQSPVERPLAAFNTAFADDGVLIRATGKAEKPVSLIYERGEKAGDAMLHHVIRVEPGAELTVLENGPAAARFSQVMEVDVADGGRLHHVRAQGRDHERRAVTHLFARLGEESTLKSFTLVANGRLTRNEAVVWLQGENGAAHISGASMGDGEFLGDDTVFVTHSAPHCESRQVFKKVLRGGAVGVFQGKILVEQPAQKTDGYQISQSLLFDERSQFLAKPELEIYADDVQCSHGSTSGEIDPDHLFYMRARGIPQAEAESLLVLAFIAEAIEEIEDETLAEDIRARLSRWLERRRA
ncbi:Fe-S cluster assembly protein SufD [Rhodobacteraceae bacterium WD3A24]|nr:Fe-S cluster assembly protein SufD [Rhodobacteraceae bacterium WD3A24]